MKLPKVRMTLSIREAVTVQQLLKSRLTEGERMVHVNGHLMTEESKFATREYAEDLTGCLKTVDQAIGRLTSRPRA